jgi:hypothetical protein
VVKGYADAGNWAEINKFMKMGKKCPVPYATLCEICFKAGNLECAKEAIMKGIPQNQDRVQLLIEFNFWVDACEEMFKHNIQDDFLD